MPTPSTIFEVLMSVGDKKMWISQVFYGLIALAFLGNFGASEVFAQVPQGYSLSQIEDAESRFYDDDPSLRPVVEAFAAVGNPVGLTLMGDGYLEGLSGYDMDIKQAIKYYQKAGEKGSVLALEMLGDIYNGEFDYPAIPIIAAKHLAKAARLGVLETRDRLNAGRPRFAVRHGTAVSGYFSLEPVIGIMEAEWDTLVLLPEWPQGTGMGYKTSDKYNPSDTQLARYQAAMSGYAKDPNDKRMLFVIKQFANLAYPPAMTQYGTMRLYGEGFSENIDEGVDFLLAAKAWGESEANYQLWYLYENGYKSFAPDPKAAKLARTICRTDGYPDC
jgi:TPR repeat protein